MSEDAGKSVGMWTMSAVDLLLTADDSDGTYEFYFVYEGESSPIITVTTDPLVITCSNNIKDGDETDVDCGGSCQSTCPDPTCNDGKQNQDETDVDCGGACGCPRPSCDSKLGCVSEKSLFWLDAGNNVAPSRIVLNSANLSGNIFKMLIQNPSANPGDFELKEYDGFLINDELGTFSGISSGNTYEYSWTTKYSDFWNSESSDGDGVYEFYFEVDSERSLELEIEVVGTMPTCDDGIKNGAETGVNYITGEGCGGECPACPIDPCLSKTVCSSYTTEGECGQDTCGAANKSTPVLGQNEKATCYWDDSNNPKCNSRITSVDPQGREIGFCNYIENIGADTCDDDGFLSYSYSAIWNWTENNVYSSDKSSEVNYVLGLDGRYHYDPDRKSALCVPGSRTIQCPAQIQLSFFTWANLVAAIVLVIIVYIILSNRKKKINKKKATKKKKIISKKRSKY